ncbi:hypothetical protein GGR51DRAFT_274110 [Nemania sp. FL0031]|nr:hypothetical protein GGR51DRAFT_274110 [Nemania sp. FL0031]
MAAYFTTMSAKHHDPSLVQRALTSPHRPNPQLRRSITEQSPPFRQSRVHQYLHRKDRERDNQVPSSAGPLVRGSLELSPAGLATPGSVADAGMVFQTGDNIPSAGEAGPNAQRLLNNDGITQEQKEKAAAAAASLKKSLVELNASSNATIAHLDETYSSVLQKLGALQSTIMAMKELAAMSQEINESFSSDSSALVSEIESQLSVYDQSTDQKKRIEDLQARIHAGRDKVQALSRRIDLVHERIESWEKADKEWQERTRRRLKVTWIVISVVAFILTFFLLGAQYAPSSTGANELAELASGIPGEPAIMDNLVKNNSKSAATMADEVREELARRRGHEQEVLRVFDEL